MSQTISSKQLAQAVADLHGDTPNFAILLGAGASVTSGIKSGEALVAAWREKFDAGLKSEDEKSANQSWYGKPQEYSALFEHQHKTAASRRRFIEKCVEGAYPHWGYLYLVSLVEAGVFNAVLTTNFDDLVDEAFHAFAPRLRPLVCSHEGGMAAFRVGSLRPKILKLHGDYLFDSIKNTRRELQSLDADTEQAFAALAQEQGLVVVGYGGNDESIMTAISKLLGNPANFPHGIHWCLRDGAEPPARLDAFAQEERLQFVRIAGFDELMAELHAVTVGVPPLVVRDPFGSFAERLASLVTVSADKSTSAQGDSGTSMIAEHAGALADKLRTNDPSNPQILLPASLLGFLEFRAGKFSKARDYFYQAIGPPNVKSENFVYFFECLRHAFDPEQFDSVCVLLERSVSIKGNNSAFLLNGTLSLIHAKKYAEAERLCDILDDSIQHNGALNADASRSNALNRLQIKVHRGSELNPEDRRTLAGVFSHAERTVEKFACHVLSGQYEEAMEAIEKDIDNIPKDITDWPIIDLLPKASANQLRSLVVDPLPHYAGYSMRFDITLRSAESPDSESA